MNPIYKTGWGQYVDLSKIVSIEKEETRAGVFIDFGCRIHFQLMENPVVSFAQNALIVTSADSHGYKMPMSEESWLPVRDLREAQIDALIMAWENYRNQ